MRSITRKNRVTKRPVTLIHADDAGLCDGDGATAWYTICEDHNCILGHESKALAQGWLAHPHEWCDECRNEHFKCDTVSQEGQQ